MSEEAARTGTDGRKVMLGAIGDLHVSESGEHPVRDLFAEMSERADVIALCGDLTNLGTAKEASVLADQLQAVSVPAVAVLGNHDYECGNAAEVVRILGEAGVHFLEEHPVEIGGIGFAGVKGFAGGFGSRMLGSFGEEAIKRFCGEAVEESLKLETSLRSLTCEKKVVVLHYAPVSDTVEGEPPEIFPFLGSSRLAETIDRFDVDAVVHGHAHHGTFRGRTQQGIPVFNCAAPVAKDGGRPYALIEI